MTITVETSGSKDHGPCACCGGTSRTVWGYLREARVPVAAYFVHWTVGRVDHGATVDLVVGRWGEGTSAADRAVVAVEWQTAGGGPQFMVVDAAGRPAAAGGSLARAALRREQVIGTALAGKVFAMLDAIWVADGRIGELAGVC